MVKKEFLQNKMISYVPTKCMYIKKELRMNLLWPIKLNLQILSLLWSFSLIKKLGQLAPTQSPTLKKIFTSHVEMNVCYNAPALVYIL
jgi:hypothetical protein